MYLGVDVSTTKIGLALIENKIISEIKYKNVLIMNSSDTLEYRASLFKKEISKIKKEYPNIENIFIEYPFFAGGNNANTVAILLRFNGMCSYILYNVFKKHSIMISPRSARSLLGIKIPKEAKKVREKKQPIINYVVDKFRETETPFIYDLTKFGNPKPGVDDIADAIILAIAGPIIHLTKQKK